MPAKKASSVVVLILLLGASHGFLPGAEPATIPPIVFVSRKIDVDFPPVNRTGPVERAEFGKLLLRGADGQVRALVDSSAPGAPPETPLDVMDPNVSFDGIRIVFAGFSKDEGSWR